MKKLAIGCLLIVVVCGIVGAGLTYYMYRQARALYTQVSQLGQVSEIERGIRAQGRFEAPASGELTKAQVDHLLSVQAHVRKQVGTRLAAMEQKYKALSEKREATIADAPALISAYSEFAAAWVEAKRSQVEALNQAGLSLEEYKWIREQAYRAAGVPFVDFDITRFAAQIQSGTPPTVDQPGQLRGSLGPTGPEANQKLTAPFKKQLEDNVALASFGL